MLQTESYWPVRIADDVIVCVKSSTDQMTSYVLLEQEDWLEDEMNFVRAFVTPDMNILDIGANHGVYALSIAKKLESGHVWAFEPTVTPGKMLEKSIELNGFADKITLVPAGLSDHAGSAEISTSMNSELNSLHGTSGSSEQIQLEKLDEFLQAQKISVPISFVKLDAEGEEISILRGGQHFFSQQSPLIMFELKHGHQVNNGLIDAFKKLGYGIYRLLPDLNILIEFDSSYTDDVLNLFACKSDQTEEAAKRGLLAQNSDIAEVVPDDYLSNTYWQQKISHFPYAGQCKEEWQAHRNEIPDGYLTALSAGMMAHDSTLPAAARVFLLQAAVNIVENLMQQSTGAHYSLWLLKIHLLHLLNRRADCVDLCHKVATAFAKSPTPGWPFLPPCAQFFNRKVQGATGTWISELLHEFFEYRQSFSSYFMADPMKNLRAIIVNKSHDLAIERRFILAAKRAGRTVMPASAAPLLNPQTSRNSAIWQQILSEILAHQA